MDKNTVPTHAMIKNLSEYLVNGMTYDELREYVYQEVYSIMLEDSDVFYCNLEQLDFDPDDFTDENFTSRII